MPRIAAVVCMLAITGCGSSASLAREGKFPAACHKARDERSDEQTVLQQRLLAEAAPELALEMVDATTSTRLQSFVGNRYENPRFARVSSPLNPKAPFDAEMSIEAVSDRNAYYKVLYVNEYVAAELVYPRPEGGLAELAAVTGLLFGISIGSVCLAAGANAPCLQSLTPSERDQMRRKVDLVNDDPKLRRSKEKLLDAAKDGAPLVVLLPNPPGRLEAPRVRLNLVLRTRFGPPLARCSYKMDVVVDLSGESIDEVVARDLSGRPRPLPSLHPTIEWGAPEAANAN